VNRGWAIALVVLGGCGRAATDHEELGDAAYGRGDFPAALAEYHAAIRTDTTPDLLAKIGLTALHAPSLREAADAYRALAISDHARLDEAAMGLELVARAAEHTADTVAMRLALTRLRALAPGQSNGSTALGLIRGGSLAPEEIVLLTPPALVAAPDAGTVDTLLLAYAGALRTTTACADAAPAYRTVLRRVKDPMMRSRAGNGYAACALQLGEEALTLKRPDPASGWFLEVVAYDSTSQIARQAMVGLGRAREAEGDIVGAAIAYQRALDAGSGADSLDTFARARLAAIGSAEPPPPDSSTTRREP
jgi:tetratricopeptide (TPR) repeat protein